MKELIYSGPEMTDLESDMHAYALFAILEDQRNGETNQPYKREKMLG